MAVQGGFSFTGNTDRVVNRLNNMVNRQLPWAMVTTLNATGKHLVTMNKLHMKRKLSKANNYTLNAYFHTRASKRNMKIVVRRKDAQRGRHYLEVLDRSRKSNRRTQKGVEIQFDRGANSLNYDGHVASVLPTKRTGGKNNRMLMSQVNIVRAGLQGFKKDDETPLEGVRYFTAGPHSLRKFGGGNKTGGIYRVTGKGKPQKLYHILPYMPKYPVRTDFYGVMKQYAAPYFEGMFQQHLRNAIKTAKLR